MEQRIEVVSNRPRRSVRGGDTEQGTVSVGELAAQVRIDVVRSAP